MRGGRLFIDKIANKDLPSFDPSSECSMKFHIAEGAIRSKIWVVKNWWSACFFFLTISYYMVDGSKCVIIINILYILLFNLNVFLISLWSYQFFFFLIEIHLKEQIKGGSKKNHPGWFKKKQPRVGFFWKYQKSTFLLDFWYFQKKTTPEVSRTGWISKKV